jgi:hypothetical protein
MTVTVIDPAAGTSNPRTWDRKVVALLSTSHADPNALLDCVVIDSTAGAVIFTLPSAAAFAGKEYVIVWQGPLAHAAQVVAAGVDTIGGAGGQTSYTFDAAGDSVTLISGGQTDWIIGGLGLVRAPATDIALGDVFISGTPDDPGGPSVPVIEVSNTINPIYVPVATALANGAVEIRGTPVSAAAPLVPVIEAGGVLGTTASPVIVPLAKITGLGAAGSITFINGLAVARTDPT